MRPQRYPPPMTFADIDAALARNDAHELARLVIGVALSPPDDPPDYAEKLCLRLAAHADPQVHGNALLGFGHIARITGAIHDKAAVHAAVAAGLAHPDATISGQAEAARDDLEHFLGWRF